MQVIGHTDYDTHSIMGGGKRHAATVNLNSGLITTLSTSLYSDNFLATVRETICNGWDAHKVSGRTHIPLEIEISATSLTIKDFGLGIPHDQMGKIYLDYGGSTKVHSDVETGGFGLGSKSPFSYTDFFNVENNHGGVKGVYTVSRGSSETDGMPDMITIVQVPTTDEGLTVEIPIADPKDVEKFTKVIMGVISLGGINAKFNGELVDCIDMAGTKEGILFTSREPYIKNGVLYVRYGNVIYPIKEHRDYSTLYQEATNLMRQTEKRKTERYGGYWEQDHNSLIAIIDCAPNSLSVVPSREDLHSSVRTVKTITEHLERFVKLFNPLYGSQFILNKEKEIIAEAVQKGEDLRPLLLTDNIIMKHYEGSTDRFKTMTGDFHSVDELIIALAANGHFYDKATLKEARDYRINALVDNESKDKDLVWKLRKMLKEESRMWNNDVLYRKTHRKPRMVQINPILRRAGSARLQPKNFIYWDTTQMPGRKLYSGQLLYQTSDRFEHLIRMTKREVMIVPHKAAIKNWRHGQPKPDFADEIPQHGCLVYVMPGTKRFADHAATVAFFERMGYKVWDIVKHINDNPAPKAVKPVKAKPTTAPKPKGHYLSINNLINEYKNFNYRRHLDIEAKDLKYISNPVAILQGASLPRNSYSPKFFPFGDTWGKEVVDIVGDQFAIAKTVIEYEKAIKNGAKPGLDYIIDKVCEAVKLDDGYKHNRQIRQVFDEYVWLNEKLYERLRQTKTCAALPDLPKEKPYNKVMFRLFQHFYDNMYRSFFEQHHKDKLTETMNLIQEWDKDPIDSPFKGFFSEGVSKRLNSINLNHILILLEDKNTSIEERVRCETLLSITLLS